MAIEGWDVAVKELQEAKEVEAEAKSNRVAIEEKIATMMREPGVFEGTCKNKYLSVTYKLSRKLDYQVYQTIEQDLPDGLKCVDLKPSLNLKKFRHLEATDPQLAAQFITAKPAKPTIKILEGK